MTVGTDARTMTTEIRRPLLASPQGASKAEFQARWKEEKNTGHPILQLSLDESLQVSYTLCDGAMVQLDDSPLPSP